MVFWQRFYQAEEQHFIKVDKGIVKFLGIHHTKTTAFHPAQTDGLVHCSLTTMLYVTGLEKTRNLCTKVNIEEYVIQSFKL